MWYNKFSMFDQQGVWNPFDPQNDVVFLNNKKYHTLNDLKTGLENGVLLAHARKSDDTDFSYGIHPSAGDFLKSTEGYQFALNEYGKGPELIFFSDGTTWAKLPYNQVIFVEKHPTIQQALEDGKTRLYDGKIVPYHMSPMADYDDILFREVPVGVETNDWYSKESQEVVAVITKKQ